MENILELLSKDLIYVGYCLAVLGVAWLSNTVLSLYFNIKIDNSSFSWNRFLTGVYKIIALVGGTGLLVCAIDLSVNIVEHISGVGNTDIGDVVTISAIVATIGLATYRYIKQSHETLVSILGNK